MTDLTSLPDISTTWAGLFVILSTMGDLSVSDLFSGDSTGKILSTPTP